MRGGARNHRLALDGAILVKDNHLRLAGGLRGVLEKLRSVRADVPVEIEVETLEDLETALVAGVSRVLVDNMASETIAEAVRRARGRAALEISGGVTLERLDALADTGADFVSVGALTHSAPAVDLSLELEPLREAP